MPASERTPTIRRNAVYALLAEIARAGLAAALVLVVTRVLGPDEFGLFALAMSVGGIGLILSDFGISPSTARFVAERRGDRRGMATVVSDAIRWKFVLAGVVSALVAALAGPIAALYDEPGLETPLRWLALALLAQSFFGLFVGAFVAMGRVSLQLVLFTGESIAETGLVITAVAVGGGAGGAMAGRAGGFVLGAALALALAVWLLGRDVRPRVRHGHGHGRRLVGYAGALFLVDSAWALFGAVDVLLIGAYLESEDVGLFDAAARLLTFAAMAGTAMATAIGPRLAAHESEAPAVEALTIGLRALTIIAALALGVLVAWAGPIVQLLLGAEYAETADVLRVGAPWVALSILGPLATVSVNYIGLAGRRLPIILAALAVNVVVDVLLIPRIGIIAAAIGSTLAFCVYVPGHLVLLRRALGLDVAALTRTTIRAVAAAAALAGVLALFGTQSLGLVEAVGGALAGSAAFVAVLVLGGEVSAAELRGLPGAVRRLRR